MSSFFGLLIVDPICPGCPGSVFCRGRVAPPTDFDDGVAVGLVLTVLGELSTLGVVPLDRGSSVPDRRAYGSAVAGRPSSGRRGFIAGRIGADDNEETCDPVGIVRVVVVVPVVDEDDLEGNSNGSTSPNVDCADSGL